VSANHAALDLQQSQDGQVLARLRARSLTGAVGITSRNASIPVAPGRRIVWTKRSWPGTSTTDSWRPSASWSGA
jgi:hypothetical protein